MNNRTGELIENYRKEKGLTQNELARQLGVSNTAISKWEHGYNLPDIGLLEPLSKILGIDMLLLLSSENEDKEEANPVKQKSKRTKLLKVSLIILLFILSITTIHILNYKHYQKELKTIKDQQVKVYRFYNYENDIIVNGYLILNNKKSTIIFEELKLQEKQRQKEEPITSGEMYLYIDGERVYRSKIKALNNQTYEKNEILELLGKNIENDKIINKLDEEKVSLKISLNNKSKKSNKIIRLKIRPEV